MGTHDMRFERARCRFRSFIRFSSWIQPIRFLDCMVVTVRDDYRYSSLLVFYVPVYVPCGYGVQNEDLPVRYRYDT